MKRVVSFLPKLRLAELLPRKGGFTAKEATQRANDRVEAMREQSIASIDDLIDALVASCPPRSELRRSHLVALSSEIFTIAATYRVEEVAHAAGCMCDLLLLADEAHRGEEEELNAKTASPVFISAILVHIDALRRLRQPGRGGEETGRAAIVEGLRLVARKFFNSERALEEDLCSTRLDAAKDEVA